MTIEISAKKWFDSVNGNTYHAVKTVIHNEYDDTYKVLLHGMSYGYGEQYMYTAYEDTKRFTCFNGTYNDFIKITKVVQVQSVKKRDLTFDVNSYIRIYGAENIYALGGLIWRSSKAFNYNLYDMYDASGMRERAIINTVNRVINRNGILRLISVKGYCEYSIDRKCFTN